MSLQTAQAAPACKQFLQTFDLTETPNTTPIQNALLQLQGRAQKVEALLKFTGEVKARQARKIISQIENLVKKGFTEESPSEKTINSAVDLSEKLIKIEEQLVPVEYAEFLPIENLRRVLLTSEPIVPGFQYRADLPSFGEVRISFSKTIANAFRPESRMRELVFPKIFKGLVSKVGDSGIKQLTDSTKIVNGETWVLLELKFLKAEDRFYIAYDGTSLHFFKYVKNHHKGMYGANAFLDEFLKTL